MVLAEIPTRLCAPTALTGTSADLFAAGTNGAIIRNIHVCNTIGADRAITLGIGSLATPGNLLLSAMVVPANDAVSLDVYIGMVNTEVLKALSSLLGGLTITVMGVT